MTRYTDPVARAIALFGRGDVSAARATAEIALAEGGDHATLRHLLGVAYCRMGNLDQGISHLERALDLTPGNPEILIMLMRALIDAGRPADALTIPFDGDGLTLSALVGLWRTRAEAAHCAENTRQEADALERVVQLDTVDCGAREMLVALLMSLDRPEAALAQIEELPPSRQRERARSSALVGMRRLDDAMAIDAALLESDPQNHESWLSLVLLADRKGDMDVLLAMVEFGVRHDYPSAELDFARALIAKQVGRIEEALTLARASEVLCDPAHRFALIASLADRIGRPAEAFDAALAQAAATPGLPAWRRRGAEHRAALERVVTAITGQWAARWPPSPPPDRPSPAFLVGFPRSGTTLLDTFLMGHPGVIVVEEQPMLDLASQILGDECDLDQVDAATVDKARAAYFAELDRHAPPQNREGRLVIDKLPLAMTGAVVIHRLFPDAKIIFARRHPADVVLSNFLQAFRLNDAMANFLDIHDAAQFYDVAMRLWMRVGEVFNLDTRDLVYEELVANPESTLRPLVEWLSLPWNDALLDHRRTAVARGPIVTPSYDQVTQPIHRRAAGRWRQYALQLEPVVQLLNPWTERLGYLQMNFER